MSAENPADLSTEELIRRFVETAKATPTLNTTDPMPENFKRTPEQIARVPQMQALGAELRERKPISLVRTLFEDENRDVRRWASRQFHSIDPEWAEAASNGLWRAMSTREALEFTRRVRRLPPSKPALKDMSDDELIARFEDAATREYGTKFIDYIGDPRDLAIRNRIIDEISAIGREAERRGVLERIIPLMDHRLVTVRKEAAWACLGVAQKRAEAVLETILAGDDLDERLSVGFPLRNWRAIYSKTRDRPLG